MLKIERRDRNTLIAIIKNNCLPGSIIYADLWRGYNNLETEEGSDYTHKTVNHSIYWKDLYTGVHTNTIEGLWNALKMQIFLGVEQAQ